MKAIQNQLDLVLATVRPQVEESVSMDKCVELTTVKFEEETSYQCIESFDLKGDP